MSLLLQPFHQQTLATFDRDARDPAVRVQPLVEIAESGDVVREPALMNQPARRIQDAELVLGVTPVQTDEHTLTRSRGDL